MQEEIFKKEGGGKRKQKPTENLNLTYLRKGEKISKKKKEKKKIIVRKPPHLR